MGEMDPFTRRFNELFVSPTDKAFDWKPMVYIHEPPNTSPSRPSCRASASEYPRRRRPFEAGPAPS